MSVAAAKGAVSTQQHQPTQDQVRLARLIEDKKHDHPEVQEILRRVLDVVTNCTQEDALYALFDCDYDCEKAVTLLMEKGREVGNEWRTATNHKINKKQQQQQQQQKFGSNKNGTGEPDEDAKQRGNEMFNNRSKSRGGGSTHRSKLQQQNGNDFEIANNQQKSDNHGPQQRPRGGHTYRGRSRGSHRGNYRVNERNTQYQHQQYGQDENDDTSSPSDMNRQNRGGVATATKQQQPDQFDVGNWNGETLIYSRTAKEDEQQIKSDDSSSVPNGQSGVNTEQNSNVETYLLEATRHIKSFIGIGQSTKMPDQQIKPKPLATTLNNKLTPPLPGTTRIPQQPVIFSDRFDGGTNKIDVQFGNIGETLDDSSSGFYQQSESASSNNVSQRTTEQNSHVSPSGVLSEQARLNQQQQQRMLSTQMQQPPPMTIKQVIPSQFSIHQQQHQINPQNIRVSSLHLRPQPEAIQLDTAYDQASYTLQQMDFPSPYFMTTTINQSLPPQQQTQQRYLVSQSTLPPQPTSTKNVSTSSVSSTATTAKSIPNPPPGIYPHNIAPMPQTAYSAAYGVPQLPSGPAYPGPYDTELLSTAFMSLATAQQASSASGAYGSGTTPGQPQTQQQTITNNDNKTPNYQLPLTENLMLIQQYQQFAHQQSNSQQQGQHPTAHSSAPLNYFLSHPTSRPGYSAGPTIMYTDTAATMAQQKTSKQQVHPYNPNNSSAGINNNEEYHVRGSTSSNKDGQYGYAGTSQSSGQQQGGNKQPQHRSSGNVYNSQSRPFS